MEHIKRFRNLPTDSFRNLPTDSLVAIAQSMRNRLNSAVATGRINIAQDARIVLDFAIRELKNRGGNKMFMVIVGNIGTVYSGESLREALATYHEYVDKSDNGYGRAAGEDVAMLRLEDGETTIEHEYIGVTE